MQRRKWTLRGAIATALAVAALAGAGCGGDSSPEATGSTDASLVGVDESAFKGLDRKIDYYTAIGGTVGEAMEEGGFARFTDLSGVPVVPEYTDATPTKFFAAQQQGGPIPWSLIQFPTMGHMLRAVEEGYLEPVDTGVVPVENVAPDFRNDHAVPTGTSNAVVVVWNTDKWPLSEEHPEGVRDLYDLERFPGRRCLLGWPDSALEQALYADGVALEDIYPLDVDRALRKLDTIKDEAVWSFPPDQVIQNLLNGECDIGVVPQGRAYGAVTESGAPLAIAWPGAFYSVGWMAVPKGAPNPEAGQAALAFWASSREANLELAEKTAYINQLTLLDAEDYPEDLREWLPLPGREDVIVSDGEYWLENGPEVSQRFTEWLGG